MKIQAKDLKIGMTAKSGNVSMVVESISKDKQVNGKELIRAIGTTIEATIKSRSYAMRNRKVSVMKDYEMVWKSETKIDAR